LTTLIVNGQGKTLYRVDVVKPKAGMRTAFEASWKLHLNTFHNTTNKRTVYQVTSGSQIGSYTIVEGPFSFADMDSAKGDGKAHALDLDRNFTPKLESGSNNFIARWIDTLSRNNVKAEKFLVTNTVVKNGKMNDYMAEVRRTVLIQDKINSPVSTNRLTLPFAGSSPMLVSIRNLKDGYQELESGPNSPEFKNSYISTYGQADWDNRLKILVDLVVKSDSHFEILRPDLSSK
jgi:hypothetical protein